MKPPACRNTRKDIGDPQIKKNVATSPCEDHVICLHTFRTNVSVSWGLSRSIDSFHLFSANLIRSF